MIRFAPPVSDHGPALSATGPSCCRDLAGSSSVFLTLGCNKSFGSVHSASTVFVNAQSCIEGDGLSDCLFESFDGCCRQYEISTA